MSNGDHQVLLIGAAGIDMKVHASTLAIEPGQSNPGKIRWGWGGVARNIAENLGRLGVTVQLITAVGDDQAGIEILAQLHSVGVETDATLIVEGKETAAYVGLHHLDGRLWAAFDDMQIIREITPGHINRYRTLFKEAEMICIDTNLSPRTLETVFRLARTYKVPVCADPTTPLLAPRLQPFLGELLAITPNRREAEALLGDTLADDAALLQGARRLTQKGVKLAVITLGADGLSYATSEESGRLPAFKSEVVDPVGAGDALTAAVVYGLLEDFPPSEAVRLGLAGAAQTIICKETVCPYLSLELLYDKLIV